MSSLRKWTNTPIKYLASCNDDVLPEDTPEERVIRYVDIGNVTLNEGITGFEEFAFAAAPSRARRLVRDGDVIVSTVRTYLRAIARIVSPEPNLVLSTGFAVFRPRESVYSRFFGYAVQSNSLVDEIVANSTGVSYPAITPSMLVSLKIPFPDLFQQRAIADFLDRETVETDALIAEYKRLLELLEERRIAVITQAVTKGLDPNVRMKDSGIEWIDEIPENWRVLRNKVLFQERDERSSSGDEELLSVSHLTGVTPRSDKTVNMFMAESLEGYKRCFKGDFVINTMWAWMGAMGTAPCDGIVSPSYNVYRVRDNENFDAAYYDLLSRIPSHVAKIKSISTGIWESRLRLYPDQFLNLMTCVPPITEQREIVAHIHSELQRNQEIALHMRAAIALLNERRQSLITAAVTGQIDVTTYKSNVATEVA